MKPFIELKTTTPLFVLIVLVFACFADFPNKAQAVNPPPDGGYPGANTAEGDNALLQPHQWHIQYGQLASVLGSNTGGNFEHGHWRRGARFQHRRPQYGDRRGGALIATPPAALTLPPVFSP